MPLVGAILNVHNAFKVKYIVLVDRIVLQIATLHKSCILFEKNQ